MGNAAIESDTV